MSTSAVDLARLRAILLDELGLVFDRAKDAFLADVLARRAGARGPSTWLDALEAGGARAQVRALAQEVTVSETYFFRHVEQIRAFAEAAVPERMRARSGPIRVLSAGCATGEEPYTLAIALRERGLELGSDVTIDAIDVNDESLERARAGRYTPWSLRDVSEATRSRWFRSIGRDWQLDESIRASVSFTEASLVRCDFAQSARAPYDIVFCRNVLMYFAAERAREVIERIANATAPNGFLFLGHAETLRGVSSTFELRHTHGTFYYSKREHAPLRSDPRLVSAWPASAQSNGGDTDWVGAVERATARIRVLTDDAPEPERGEPPGHPELDLGPAMKLLEEERFDDAYAFLATLPLPVRERRDARLLEAVLRAHRGDFVGAAEITSALLVSSPLDAEAHYVLALCSEAKSDEVAATKLDQMAAYLDPSFAMPHVHLGLLAKRAGHAEAMRQALASALALLERDSAERLLLFGGGFGRRHWMAFCRAELGAAEEESHGGT